MRPTNVYSRLYLPQPQLILLDGLLGWSWRICWTVDENFGWSTPHLSLCVTNPVPGTSNDSHLLIFDKDLWLPRHSSPYAHELHVPTCIYFPTETLFTWLVTTSCDLVCVKNYTRYNAVVDIPFVRRAANTVKLHRTIVNSIYTFLAVLQTTTRKPPSPQVAKSHFSACSSRHANYFRPWRQVSG